VCPACITTYLVLVAAGTGSSGGLAALIAKQLFSKSSQNEQTNKNGEKLNETGDIGAEDRWKRNEL
jgi:hypothetical protein